MTHNRLRCHAPPPLLAALCLLAACASPRAAEPPVVPVGLDAYRQWDRWPAQRIGCRAYMRSTYDRAGDNEGADAGHFLRQEAEDFNVALDAAGPGVLYFVRTNHWHGSPWHYVVDGRDTLVQETSTRDPDHPVPGSVFLPETLFPNPLTWTWSVTKGADLMWVPIPFEKSLALAYSRTHYGTGYFIYHLFPEGATNLSRPIRSWDARTPPDPEVLDLLRRAGEDIAPTGPGVRVSEGALDLSPEGAVTIAELREAPAVLRALRFTVPRAHALAFGRARLRITWDGRAHPSVDAPLALFFGAGTLYNRDNREFLVRGLPMTIRFDERDVHLSVYYPMPFFRGARIELVAQGEAVPGIRWHARTQPCADPPGTLGYFHATYRDHGAPTPGLDLVPLDTTRTEGGGDWCGSFVGMSWIFSDRAALSTLEGDPRFFFDDSQSPQGYGTGTEEWGGGGDYWGGENMTLPLAGHPVGCRKPAEAKCEEDKIESAYRFLLADLMPFGRNARIQLEHGGENQSTERYRSVVYWYGLPGAALVPTDAFHVGDPEDEKRHRYASPTASPVRALRSRYEWGVDRRGGREFYPETEDTGRNMTDTSEFTVQLRRDNFGVLLRRKLDYGFPDQRAEVSVADDREGAEFERAGTWYLAGSNRCLYSNPPKELDVSRPIYQTSNRRWREDEFLIPRRLTEGRRAIRVRIRFTPVNRPIHPGLPVPEQAWSEYRYAVYCYVMPRNPR